MTFPPDMKVDEASQPTKFFVCKKDTCKGAYCIACRVHFTREEISTHSCKIDEEFELYLKVVDTLARAATLVCPRCKFPVMKDLECKWL
jgi:hypothetical protein